MYICFFGFDMEWKQENVLQKQTNEKKVDMECLFYNKSPASAFHWFVSRNVTLPVFLVPYPFKIEASLQNSLTLQCTRLCIFLSVWSVSNVNRALGFQKHTANDVDHTAISAKKNLFLKTTTSHRLKHWWTVEEKEHHLKPERDLKIFFSFSISTSVVRKSERAGRNMQTSTLMQTHPLEVPSQLTYRYREETRRAAVAKNKTGRTGSQ